MFFADSLPPQLTVWIPSSLLPCPFWGLVWITQGSPYQLLKRGYFAGRAFFKDFSRFFFSGWVAFRLFWLLWLLRVFLWLCGFSFRILCIHVCLFASSALPVPLLFGFVAFGLSGIGFSHPLLSQLVFGLGFLHPQHRKFLSGAPFRLKCTPN